MKGFEIDGDLPYPIYSVQCMACVHYHGNAEKTCKAFPRGIPHRILLGDFKHTRPYPGDHGIRFEEKKRG